MLNKHKEFKISKGDTVFVRAPGGIYEDTVTDILKGGIVVLQHTLINFYMTGKPIGMGKRSVYSIINIVKKYDTVPDDWLQQLKIGDRVILAWENGKKLLTHVERITATGRIKVRHNTELFYQDGTCVHRGHFKVSLQPAIENDVKILQKQVSRELALETINKCKFDELDFEKLIKIQDILQKQPTDKHEIVMNVTYNDTLDILKCLSVKTEAATKLKLILEDVKG